MFSQSNDYASIKLSSGIARLIHDGGVVLGKAKAAKKGKKPAKKSAKSSAKKKSSPPKSSKRR